MNAISQWMENVKESACSLQMKRPYAEYIETPRNFSYVATHNILTTKALFQKFKPLSFIYICIALDERICSNSSVWYGIQSTV